VHRGVSSIEKSTPHTGVPKVQTYIGVGLGLRAWFWVLGSD
jgi:hypothetical protein